jgi:magnesium transporter
MRRQVARTARVTIARASRLLNFHKRHPPVGAPPGTLVFPEERVPVSLSVMAYRPEGVEERRDVPLDELPALLAADRVTWIDVQGLGDETVLRRLGQIFEIHPLALEDVVNVPQRPKAEVYENGSTW